MPVSTGKRRTSSHAMTSPSSHGSGLNAMASHTDAPLKSSYGIDDTRSAVGRRRRFIMYTLAFALMLGMSSVLDVRRAALRNRHAKLQLSLPSSSLSSLSDSTDETDTMTSTSSASSTGTSAGDSSKVSSGTAAVPVAADRLPPAPLNHAPNGADTAPQDKHSEPRHDYRLSQQELDDGVDQLIAHVDQEESATGAGAGSSGTSAANTTAVDSTSINNASGTDAGAKPNGGNSDVQLGQLPYGADGSSPLGNTTISDNVPLNAEDHFRSAVLRITALLRDETTKRFVDENDVRTLQALELQATRGDCELKSGTGTGSLFKTDAEAASYIDIERTHPLWGAWCLFMGSYKTDAMRDYVTKEQVVEHKVSVLRDATAQNNSSTTPVSVNTASTPFDPTAASLDDVLSPEQQSALRVQTEMVASHLGDNDLRYLAALSLQATFGDCGPYGREALVPVDVKDGEERAELRRLREPLFEQTVTRKEGALWGAWCVMQGKKRTTAAADLTHRVELLVEQLTKSQAVNQDDVNRIDPSSASADMDRLDSTTRGISMENDAS